ncbi:odorant receptor 2a-like [Stomoxys calcitrans]|uniref:Odorant receptor n=1 Tax=Stomoxys calcitrans TaxID=35570 RepID=A0A1I8PUM5_STOCA|nr:odorant receptor 2a-like [Stomoxys calcitrans]
MPKEVLCLTLDTNSAFQYQWKVWHYMGIKAPENINRKLYQLYAVFINSFVTLLFPLTLIVNVFLAQNLQQLCENLTITLSDSLANVKFINVYLVRHELDSIQLILRRLDSRIQTRGEYNILKSAIRKAQTTFLIFLRLFTVGTVLSVVKIILAEKRSLLYPAWFGVNWEESAFKYAIVISYQLFGLIVQALQNVANDSYPPSYLIILTGHMEALEIRVKALGNHADGTLKVSLTAKEQNDCLKELNECIKDYINILKLHSTIQRVISKACLAQFVCSALIQCIVGLHFLYVVDTADYEATILSVIFFVAITMEVFVICYFGQMMSLQSWNLTYAFYSCGWLAQSPIFKRNLIITLIRTQRTSIILAGSYIPLNLPTFVQLMKFAYSTFTLLIRFK